MSTVNRRALHVAPPLRRAVNRHSPLQVPLRQIVLLATHDVTPEELLRRPNSEKRGRDERKESDDGIHRVAVFAWSDTTLRELLEAIVQQHAEAVALWVGSDCTDSMQVKACHVFPGEDRKPILKTIASLRYNGPTDSKNDLITFAELAEPNRHEFKSGDLIVLTKVCSSRVV